MKNCNYFQRLVVEDFYSELDTKEKQSLNNHLESCNTCHSYKTEIQSTLKEMTQYERPQPTQEFWDNYWLKLEPKLELKQPAINKFSSFFQFKISWIYGIATAAVFLIIGVFIGKTYFTIHPTDEHLASEINKKNIQTVATAERYLQRSKVLLLGIVNMDIDPESDYKPSISKQQKISKDLIKQTAVLKEDLEESNQKLLLQLIKELETILLQIANLEEEYDYDAIELIQSSLDRKGILVKINLSKILSDNGKKEKNSNTKSKKQI